MLRYIRNILIVALSVLLLTIVISLFSSENETDASTTQCDASVIHFEKNMSVDGEYVSIYTYEIPCPLYVGPQVYSKYGNAILEQLNSKDKIYFKIHKSIDLTQENLPFVPIYELKTENSVIFSLDDYNAVMNDTWGEIQIAKIVVCFLSGVIIFLLLLKNRTLKKPSIKRNDRRV